MTDGVPQLIFFRRSPRISGIGNPNFCGNVNVTVSDAVAQPFVGASEQCGRARFCYYRPISLSPTFSDLLR
jgi:hypothetical protein